MSDKLPETELNIAKGNYNPVQAKTLKTKWTLESANDFMTTFIGARELHPEIIQWFSGLFDNEPDITSIIKEDKYIEIGKNGKKVFLTGLYHAAETRIRIAKEIDSTDGNTYDVHDPESIEKIRLHIMSLLD